MIASFRFRNQAKTTEIKVTVELLNAVAAGLAMRPIAVSRANGERYRPVLYVKGS